jgi:cell division protein FtsX
MDYISSKNYVVDGNGDESMRLLYIVKAIISVVVGVGLLVSALAFFLLLVSILLMVEKNRYKNEVLHQLGYPHAKIALPYQLLAGVVDLFVWLIAMVIVGMVYPLAIPILQLVNPNFEGSYFWPVGLSGVGLCLVFILIHYLLIRRRIRKI